MQTNPKKHAFHLGIAEKGKIYCLQGNYKEALRHFKEAIKMTQNQKNGDIFFQHYSQCVMEILELSGAYDDVINYCEKILIFLKTKNDKPKIVEAYTNFLLEKIAIQYVLKNESSEALDVLKQIKDTSKNVKKPISDSLFNWLQRGYQISTRQIHDLQNKNNYFIIRKETTNPKIAIELPEAIAHF